MATTDVMPGKAAGSHERRPYPGGAGVPDHRSSPDDCSHNIHASAHHDRRQTMQTKQFLHLAGLALTVLLVLCVSSGGADASTLVGTWDHTFQLPEESCTAPCLCPGGTPNVPFQE